VSCHKAVACADAAKKNHAEKAQATMVNARNTLGVHLITSRTNTPFISTIGNPATQAAIYTPPVGESVIWDKLSNWERFIHESPGIDPLVVMAVAHYQFEAIHPFEDGNGRTGRIINVLMLMSAGLISEPILYLSRYIIEKKDEYYRLLLNDVGSPARRRPTG
jgi:Fic family protein